APRAAPGRALLRQGGGRQGAAAAGVVLAGHRGRRGPERRAARRALGARRRDRRLADPFAHDGRRGRRRAMTLPGWMEPLYAAQEMRDIDRWAIEERGVPGMELMERAGAAVAREGAARRPGGPVAIVCGKGNNGGDGFVAGRRLRRAGRDVRVLLAGDAEGIRGDAAEALRRLGGPPDPFVPEALEHAAVAVDALLGTGSTGAPRGAVAEAIEALGRAGAPVVAVDVPSGVDASTGEVAEPAVRADLTVTFHAAKPGLWIAPGKEHAGEVRVADIGIPPGAPVEPAIGLIRDEVLLGVPRRLAPGTKFSSGHVLVCGGSTGLTGAPCMAAE